MFQKLILEGIEKIFQEDVPKGQICEFLEKFVLKGIQKIFQEVILKGQI